MSDESGMGAGGEGGVSDGGGRCVEEDPSRTCSASTARDALTPDAVQGGHFRLFVIAPYYANRGSPPQATATLSMCVLGLGIHTLTPHCIRQPGLMVVAVLENKAGVVLYAPDVLHARVKPSASLSDK